MPKQINAPCDGKRVLGSSDVPKPSTLRVLLLEDSEIDADLIINVLCDSDIRCEVVRVSTRDEFVKSAALSCYDLILADYALPTFDGLSALVIARDQCPEVPFIFVSGVLGEDVAVEAMKGGASDYVIKQKLSRLPHVITRVLAEANAHAERRVAEQALQLLNETLELRVIERTQELAEANSQLRLQIAERERVEDVLRQSQRIEAVGQLTSGVAHDFNNLLTVISGNLEFLEKAVTDPKNQRRILMMRQAADRGAKLTAQMLAFARRQKLEPLPVQLNQTVTSMRDLLESSIGGAIRIETTLQDELWPAMVDATQIELVILNLAINARDAMTVGGCLTIETANVRLENAPVRPEEPQPGDYVMVAITDSGTGIEQGVLKRVFEPFFTTKDIGKGSGLGLAQVYGFAKQSGGGVRIDTEVNKGTSVKVYLPRVVVDQTASASEPAKHHPSAEESSWRGRKPVLMVVDDDNAVRDVTVTMLAEAGFTVREADSGMKALRMLEDEPRVDLVLLDYAMPGMNGAEVGSEISRRWPRVPIVFVTGYADISALKKFTPIVVESIVQKPFARGELLHHVNRSLTSHRADKSTRMFDRSAVNHPVAIPVLDSVHRLSA